MVLAVYNYVIVTLERKLSSSHKVPIIPLRDYDYAVTQSCYCKLRDPGQSVQCKLMWLSIPSPQ